jgi:hypothetical protein
MKRIVAGLELLWAVANVALAYLFITNAFVSKTAIKEGLPAQAALLLSGLAIGLFALLLGRASLMAIRGPSSGAA